MKLVFEHLDREQIVTPNNRYEFINWISEHDQAFNDLVSYVRNHDPEWDDDAPAEENLDYQSAGDLDEWLEAHNQLYQDWYAYANSHDLLD